MLNRFLSPTALSLTLTACLGLAAPDLRAQAAQAAPVAVAPAAVPPIALQPARLTPAASQAMMLGVARADRRLVAVGEHGIVLLSDDDGKSFRQAKAVPSRSTLTAVSFVDSRHGWAVGHWGVVLATADGGDTWQIQRSDVSVDQPLFSVHFKDAREGWAVGLWSLMLATKDGGATWTPIKLPPPPGATKADRNLYAIFAGPDGRLMVAAEQGMVLESEDQGASWSYAQTAYKGSFWTGTTLRDGTILVGGLRGKIFRSADHGKTWQESTSPLKNSITGFAENGNRTLAVGLDGAILESRDGGVSFEGRQRPDRAALTTLTLDQHGHPVLFSRRGVVRADSDKSGDR